MTYSYSHNMTTDTRPTIKLSVEVYEALKRLATQNHRSIVGQIAFFVSEERQQTPTTTRSKRSQT